MGTRADFYIDDNGTMKWLGSIAWDGMPDSMPKELLDAATQEEYVSSLKKEFDSRKDVTLPEEGWPWEDSTTTDFAYYFKDCQVLISSFGSSWFTKESIDAMEDEEQERFFENSSKMDCFPNMKSVQKVKLGGPKSGLIIIRTGAGLGKEEN